MYGTTALIEKQRHEMKTHHEKTKAASAEAIAISAGPVSSLAVATCSLPVSSDILGTPLDSDPRFMADSLPGWALRASRHAWCPLRGPKTVEEMALLFVEELRREMGFPSLRQPEENSKDEPRP